LLPLLKHLRDLLNPLPLLLYHNSQKPVGQVTFKRPTKDGIDFEAQLPAIDEAGAQWEVRVRFDDGSRETLRYYERPRLRVGDEVHLEDGRLLRD